MISVRRTFPFTAIVGQDEMKLALVLNIVDPGIGGVLIRGEKGTAKSTAVRSLADVLPDIDCVRGCRFRCDPSRPGMLCGECAGLPAAGTPETERVPVRVVELPLSATEDRIAGTMDLEHVLKTGEKRFEPGVLAQANRNILYIDEVNLLEDHLVDLLLDAAAMGVNHVEREGVSFSHPSRFTLVGSMNPEEGELRPQLLDRFGLCVDILGEEDAAARADVVMRRLAYDEDPDAFAEAFRSETEALRGRIAAARDRLGGVAVSRRIAESASNIAMHFGMEGHRADITLIRAARANAALEGKAAVDRDDFRAVAPMALMHRMKRKPFEKSGADREEIIRCIKMY
jgi:magnesium chelatase subunit I